MGSVYGGGFVIGARNFAARWYYPTTGAFNPDLTDGGWYDVGEGNPPDTIAYFALDATTRYYQDRDHTTVPVGIQRLWRYQLPERVVNDVNFSDGDWASYDQVGPNMISEQMAIASTNTSMGITLIQKAYSFAPLGYDDFVIVEYIFKNTGNIDTDTDIEYPDNQVQGCYLGLKFVPKPSGLTGRIVSGAGGWSEGSDDWIDYYGHDYEDWVSSGVGDSLRVIYGWDGDANETFCSPDDEGDPLPSSGIFMSPQYPGMAILHVDKSVNDPSDDPGQPISSYYSWGGHVSGNKLSVSNPTLGQEGIWNTLGTSGYFPHPFDWDTWNQSQVEIWHQTAAGGDPNDRYYKTGTLGFGPYEFDSVGDSIRIVTCYSVGSISWAKSIEIGEQWKNRDVTGMTQDEKNGWLRTGRDSLFAKIGRVRSLFRQADGSFDFSMAKNSMIDQNIPDPPLWPDVSISSVTGGVKLEWSDIQADSFRVYRRISPEFHLETPVVETYPLVYSGPGNVLTWTDEDVVASGYYWYSVTAVKDGIESSKYVNRTDPSTSDPMREGASPYSVPPTLLDSVFVVPNPYHAHAVALYENWQQDRIAFVGLPAACRIRVFTQTGNLVATIPHELTLPPSSTEFWYQLTDYDQYIASGVYIFVVDQTKDHNNQDLGVSKVGKFVVIR
jgi:hypothetical protein